MQASKPETLDHPHRLGALSHMAMPRIEHRKRGSPARYVPGLEAPALSGDFRVSMLRSTCLQMACLANLPVSYPRLMKVGTARSGDLGIVLYREAVI